MMQQFVALGRYFLQADGARNDAASYAQDPSVKFRSKHIYLLVFDENGFNRIQVEEYSRDKKGWYLYHAGPSNGCDATPTTGLPTWKPGDEDGFRQSVTTRLGRLRRSIDRAIDFSSTAEQSEVNELRSIFEHFLAAEPALLEDIKNTHPNPKESATLSIAWEHGDVLKRVGDYTLLCRAVEYAERHATSGKKSQGGSSGIGKCSICAAPAVPVDGFLQIPHFRFYTLDKQGSVSGGFDHEQA
ncbi:MAG: TM1802 family CRISPR-associated protein, partial [Candidatus Binataceae bacterium]